MADDITNIPSTRSDFLNPDGTVNRVWYRFFFNLFTLLGAGTTSTSTDDLQLEPLGTTISVDQVNSLFQQALLSVPTPQPALTDPPADVFPAPDLSYIQSQLNDMGVSPASPPPGISSSDLVTTNGDVVIQLPGKGLRIKEGSDARMGVSTLVAGTVVVSNISVTANTRILTTRQALGGTAGHLSIGAVTPGISFVINSSSITDTSVILWVLIEPA